MILMAWLALQCVAHVDVWKEIYSQTTAARFAKDNCKLGDCNVKIDDDNFINFNGLEEFEEFHFKIVWNEGESVATDGTNDKGMSLEWKQSANPLAETDQNMNPTEIRLLPMDIVPPLFDGLSVSTRADTLLDGNVGKWWWYSIGYGTAFTHAGVTGQPAYLYDCKCDGKKAVRTQLFIKIPPGHTHPDEGFVVERNKLIQHLPTLFKQWRVALDIMPVAAIGEWGNIIHIGLGGNVDSYGDRNPAIWFSPNTTKLHLASGVNGYVNYAIDTDQPLPINQWASILISQMKIDDDTDAYNYTVTLNGEVLHQTVNYVSYVYHNVKVYAGDNYYSSASARIRNFSIETFPDDNPNDTICVYTADNFYTPAEAKIANLIVETLPDGRE